MADKITIKPYDSYDIATFAIQGNVLYTGHFGGSYDDADNKILTVEEQTVQAFRNLEKALKEIHLDLHNLLKVTVILRDISDFDGMHAAWKQVFSRDYPARTTITSDFVDAHCRIQIEAIASMS
ncbi:MAG TPA: RidA family protein [Anaerolineales bacterium]|nr:RidA family protein [Anaerolineales bacterium]